MTLVTKDLLELIQRTSAIGHLTDTQTVIDALSDSSMPNILAEISKQTSVEYASWFYITTYWRKSKYLLHPTVLLEYFKSTGHLLICCLSEDISESDLAIYQRVFEHTRHTLTQLSDDLIYNEYYDSYLSQLTMFIIKHFNYGFNEAAMLQDLCLINKDLAQYEGTEDLLRLTIKKTFAIT